MRFLSRFLNNENSSYSQCGEDKIIKHLFYSLGITTPSYLDIGAYHPILLSNTFLFYKNGARGVLVEPDPSLFKVLKKKRKKDLCLNVGISDKNHKEAKFFVMSSNTLNTFSFDEAKRIEKETSVKICKTINVQLIGINILLKDHFAEGLDLLSVDVEGLDFKIINSIDFSILRPKVICAETITYSENRNGKKIDSIFEIMNENNYFLYADTYINSIFVDNEQWEIS